MHETQYNTDMNGNIIDETALRDLHNAIGDDALNDFLERFQEDCKTRTNSITESYYKSQFSEVELEAHTLATSAATYGALELSKICREIEFAKPIKNKCFQERIDRLNILSDQSLRALREYTV